jgi:uncharacterized protein (DUF2141 family)
MKLVILGSILCLFAACANPVVPTGGPKDTTPPELLKSKPAANSLNYKEKSITLEFNEYIRVENLNAELIISPPLNKNPTHKVKGKTLVLKWEDTLRENTTYTFFFGQAIKDNNEGNILENFSLTFSTGNVIDTAELKGNIKFEYDKEPLKNAFVYLVTKPLYDSSFFPVKAEYLTKTNSTGNFNFKGLKDGEYYIMSIEDKNKNKKPDPGEAVAFLNHQVSTFDSVPSQLYSFLYNTKGRVYFSHFGSLTKNTYFFKFNESFYTDKNNLKILAKGVGEDSFARIRFIQKEDSLLFQYERTSKTFFRINSNNLTLIETDTIESSGSKTSPMLFQEKEKFTKTTKPFVEVFSTKKISFLDTSRIRIGVDTLNYSVEVSIDSTGENPYVFYIHYDYEAGKDYSITIRDSFLMDTDSFYNKSFKQINYSPKGNDGLSQVVLTFFRDSVFNTDLIVILKKGNDFQYFYLDEKEAVLKLQNIEAGSYNLIVIADLNKNKIWDSGNLFNLKQSEPVFIMDKAIEIKEDWDFDSNIKIYRYLPSEDSEEIEE